MAIKGSYTDDMGREWPEAYARVSVASLSKVGSAFTGVACVRVWATEALCKGGEKQPLLDVRTPFAHVPDNEVLDEAYLAGKALDQFSGWEDC